MAQARKKIKQEAVERDWNKDKTRIPVSMSFIGLPEEVVPYMFPTKCLAKDFTIMLEGTEAVQMTVGIRNEVISRTVQLKPGLNTPSIEVAGMRGEMLDLMFQGNRNKTKQLTMSFIVEV